MRGRRRIRFIRMLSCLALLGGLWSCTPTPNLEDIPCVDAYAEELLLRYDLPLQARCLGDTAEALSRYLQEDYTTVLEVVLETGDYANAAEIFIQKYRLASEAQDTVAMLRHLSSLAICYLKLGDNQTAEKYLNKTDRLFDTASVTQGTMAVWQALGLLYQVGGWAYVAQVYFEEALQNAQIVGDSAGIAFSRILLGGGLLAEGKLQRAKAQIEQCRSWILQSGHEELLMLWNISEAKVCTWEGDTVTAASYYTRAENWARAHRLYADWIPLLGKRTRILADAGDTLFAYYAMLRAVEARDSLRGEHHRQDFELADRTAEYEEEVRELSDYIAEHAEDFANRPLRISGWILLVLLVLLATLALVKMRRLSTKARLQRGELVAHEEVARRQLEEKELLDREWIHTVDKLDHQKQQLEDTRRRVLHDSQQLSESIQYTSLIQRTVQPSLKELGDYFPQSFLISRPKEFVSADMPWFALVGEEAYIGMLDCGGAGVASASLTVMAYMLLNQVAQELDEMSPNAIVQEVVYRFRRLLRKTEKAFQMGVSLKVGVLCVNKHSQQARYASLGNPLFYTLGEGEVYYLSGGRGSGGVSDVPEEVLFPINPRTTFYLTTDGYYSQLNPIKRAIGSSGFSELLQELQSQSLYDQKSELLNRLSRYRVAEKQTDDVTVIGLSLRPEEE